MPDAQDASSTRGYGKYTRRKDRAPAHEAVHDAQELDDTPGIEPGMAGFQKYGALHLFNRLLLFWAVLEDGTEPVGEDIPSFTKGRGATGGAAARGVPRVLSLNRAMLLKFHIQVTLLCFLLLALIPFPRHILTLPAVMGSALCLMVFYVGGRRLVRRVRARN